MAHTILRWGGHVAALAAYGGVDAFVASGGDHVSLVDITGREIRRLWHESVDKIELVGDLALLARHEALHAVDIPTGACTWSIATNSDADLVVGGDAVVTISNWGDVRAWDLATGAARGGFKGSSTGSLLVHPDGRRVLTADALGTGVVWDIARGAPGATFPASSLLGFLDDDVVLAGGRNVDVTAWRITSGEQLYTRTRGTQFTPAIVLPDRARLLRTIWSHGPDSALDIAFEVVGLADGATTAVPGWSDLAGQKRPTRLVALAGERAVAVTQEGVVVALDLAGGPSRILGAHGGSVRAAIAVGGHAVTGSIDGTLCIWDLDDAPAVLEHTAAITAILPRADDVITTSEDGRIKRWVGDRVVETWTKGRGRIMAATLAPDGSLVTTHPDEMSSCVRAWDLAHGTNRRIEGETMAGPPHMPTFTARLGSAFAIAALPDGRLATAADARLVVWSATGEVLAVLENHQHITGVAIHPDGRSVITGASDAIRIWDLATRQHRALAAGTDSASTIAVGGDLLVFGGNARIDGSSTLEVWSLSREARIHVLAGHGLRSASALATDGARGVSGDNDGVLILWDLVTGRELARRESVQRITACALLPDGRIACGDAAGGVTFGGL